MKPVANPRMKAFIALSGAYVLFSAAIVLKKSPEFIQFLYMLPLLSLPGILWIFLLVFRHRLAGKSLIVLSVAAFVGGTWALWPHLPQLLERVMMIGALALLCAFPAWWGLRLSRRATPPLG